MLRLNCVDFSLKKEGGDMKRFFWGIMSFAAIVLGSFAAFAQENVSAPTSGSTSGTAALAIASGIGIAIAAFGGALGQGRAASTALEGIARNPEASTKIQTPMIIALALIESLVIYALVIAFLLQGKI